MTKGQAPNKFQYPMTERDVWLFIFDICALSLGIHSEFVIEKFGILNLNLYF